MRKFKKPDLNAPRFKADRPGILTNKFYNGIINCRIGIAPRSLLEKLYNV